MDSGERCLAIPIRGFCQNHTIKFGKSMHGKENISNSMYTVCGVPYRFVDFFPVPVVSRTEGVKLISIFTGEAKFFSRRENSMKLFMCNHHWHILIWTACCNTCWLKACVANWSWRLWEWLLMGYNADHTHLSSNMSHDWHSLLWFTYECLLVVAVGRILFILK